VDETLFFPPLDQESDGRDDVLLARGSEPAARAPVIASSAAAGVASSTAAEEASARREEDASLPDVPSGPPPGVKGASCPDGEVRARCPDGEVRARFGPEDKPARPS
jgi:hypothetical protein